MASNPAIVEETPPPEPEMDVRTDTDPAPDPESSGPPAWVPEQYRQNQAVTRYNTLEEFVGGSLEREKLIGRTIQPPADDASLEDRIAFYQKIPGMPKDAASYDVKPLGLPDDMPSRINSDLLLDVMYNNGVPPHAADAIMRHLEQQEGASWETLQRADQEQETAARAALDEKWGAAFVERNLAVALEGLRREFGGVEWLSNLVTTDSEGNQRLLENSPEFADMAYRFAKFLGHDRFVPGGQGMPTTVAQARRDLDDARSKMFRGEMSEDQYNALELKLAPIAYSVPDEDSDDDVQVGAPITRLDLEDER